MKSGTLTTATVSDRGWEDVHPSRDSLGTPTFTFVDSVGVQRWVTRTMVINRHNPLDNGDTTRLWYDPNHPGNTKRIVIEAVLNAKASDQ